MEGNALENVLWMMNHRWNGYVIFTKFPSLAAQEVINFITSSAAWDENFIKMTAFPFQWQQFEITGIVVNYGISNTTVLEIP